MSKLAHSNTETMEEIEFRNHGITKMPLPPSWPICEAKTPPKHYRPEGGTCPRRAWWVTQNGKKLCLIHARQVAVSDGEGG